MPMNILIVDDSKAMRMIVRKTLRQAGFGAHNFFMAGDGLEALEIVKTTPMHLILSDWNMPNMNGIELLKALRDAKSRVVFGFVTTEGTPDMRAKAMATGAQFVIVKPFTAEQFEETLVSVFKSGGASYDPGDQQSIVLGKELNGVLVPTAESVATLLTAVLSRKVEAVEWKKGVDLTDKVCVGLFESDERGHECVCVTDLPLAAFTGGALTMIHAESIQTELKTMQLSQALKDSIGEMFNVFARLFNLPSGRRLKLAEVAIVPSSFSPTVQAYLENPKEIAQMVVNVPGYGRGKLSAYVGINE